MSVIEPLCTEIPYQNPADLFASFADDDWAIFLDSAKAMQGFGHYSFIGMAPRHTLVVDEGKAFVDGELTTNCPWQILQTWLTQFKLDPIAELPPCQGGVLGYLAYEAGEMLERLPQAKRNADDINMPLLALGLYDVMFALDVEHKRAWGFAYPDARAENKLAEFVELLDKLEIPPSLNRLRQGFGGQALHRLPAVALAKADQGGGNKVISNHTKETYCAAVQQVIDHIYAGDIFEANISQRFYAELPDTLTPYALYTRLRELNPAPFASYFKTPYGIIASASPERFLQVKANKVYSFPIKGTRKRSACREQDAALAEELVKSEKDQAENVMIVDLLRNDLSKVCVPGTVKVNALCALNSFTDVHHLISEIEGELKPEHDLIALLKACYPGGSITGAPKIRAQEIIHAIEPHQRGPYCGSMLYLGFNGYLDSSILIRTFTIKDNHLSFHAGGAIVADSDPESEFEETLTKAKSLMRTLNISIDEPSA